MDNGRFIINERTGKYIHHHGKLSEDWKEEFAHTRGESWYDVHAFRIWDHHHVNGIPYFCELCRDGGMYILLADRDQFTESEIEAAIDKLRSEGDIAKLQVWKLKKTTMDKQRLKCLEMTDAYLDNGRLCPYCGGDIEYQEGEVVDQVTEHMVYQCSECEKKFAEVFKRVGLHFPEEGQDVHLPDWQDTARIL